MNIGTAVQFRTDKNPEMTGFVTRVWNEPANDPYVTIRTDEDRPRTFVRCSSAVSPYWPTRQEAGI
jgi:hypothetical protein